MIRFYLSQLVDAPAERGVALEPAVAIHCPVGWSIHDLRDDSRVASGQVLVRADVTNAQHLLIVADLRNSEVQDSKDVPISRRNPVPSTLNFTR